MLSALMCAPLVFVAALPCAAAPAFYLSPGPLASGDLAWQAAVGPFTEFDFDGFQTGDLIDFLSLPGITVDIDVVPYDGSAIEESALAFEGSFANGGGQYGTVSGAALFNAASFTSGVRGAIRFQFSQPVSGAGFWLFDDVDQRADAFEVEVVDGLGAAWVSPLLDANPGQFNHTVEGFIGVVSPNGITQLTVRGIDTNTSTNAAGFELDHMQIATAIVVVPEPSTKALIFALASALVLGGQRSFARRS